MQSVLRRIVAGPRAPHPEANLDLCYVTDSIIATSGPSATYPSRAYRNPLDELVRFLDEKHGDNWAIWEFRAEGTGYPDSEVYGRIWHFPWPDHHPPPFHLIPNIMASMRNWLHPEDQIPHNGEAGRSKEGKESKRVVVVHCKAGKGRSGTAACAYLMSEEGWAKKDALQRFTERRMRPGLGAGISIPSQLRWIDYVERWVRGGKIYVEQVVEILEVHLWGLRDGVKLCIESYVEDGRKIKIFHRFTNEERDDIARPAERWRRTKAMMGGPSRSRSPSPPASPSALEGDRANTGDPQQTSDVIFRPSTPILLPTNDINIAIERRVRASYGLTMVTSIAHVWFNAFLEGRGPENHYQAATEHAKTNNDTPPPGAPWAEQSGVFTIPFDGMDGIKGSSTKGTRAFDKIAVVWRVPASDTDAAAAIREKEYPRGRPRVASVVVREPVTGEPVLGRLPADWTGAKSPRDEAVVGPAGMGTSLGLRPRSVEGGSREVSRAGSVAGAEEDGLVAEGLAGVDGAGQDVDSDEDGVEGVRRGVVDLEEGKEEGQGT